MKYLQYLFVKIIKCPVVPSVDVGATYGVCVAVQLPGATEAYVPSVDCSMEAHEIYEYV